MVDLKEEQLFSILKEAKQLCKEFLRLNLRGEKLIQDDLDNKLMALNTLKNFINPENEWTIPIEDLKLLDSFYSLYVFNHCK